MLYGLSKRVLGVVTRVFFGYFENILTAYP